MNPIHLTEEELWLVEKHINTPTTSPEMKDILRRVLASHEPDARPLPTMAELRANFGKMPLSEMPLLQCDAIDSILAAVEAFMLQRCEGADRIVAAAKLELVLSKLVKLRGAK